MTIMMKFNIKGTVEPASNGGFVLFSDTQELSVSTMGFVENLLDQVTAGKLSKHDALNALQVMFKLCLS